MGMTFTRGNANKDGKALLAAHNDECSAAANNARNALQPEISASITAITNSGPEILEAAHKAGAPMSEASFATPRNSTFGSMGSSGGGAGA